MTHMKVNVDEPGRNVELRDIHNFSGLVSWNVFFDSSDFTLEDGDVSHLVNVIGGVNHMAALLQQVIVRGLGKYHDRRSDSDCDRRNYSRAPFHPGVQCPLL